MMSTQSLFNEEVFMALRKQITDESANCGQAIWTLTFHLTKSQSVCASSKSLVLVKQATMRIHTPISLDTP